MPSVNWFNEKFGGALLSIEAARDTTLAIHSFVKHPGIPSEGNLQYCVANLIGLLLDLDVAKSEIESTKNVLEEMLVMKRGGHDNV